MTKEEFKEHFGEEAFNAIGLLHDIPYVDKDLSMMIWKQAYMEVLSEVPDSIFEIEVNKGGQSNLYFHHKDVDKKEGVIVPYSWAHGLHVGDLMHLMILGMKSLISK